MLASEFSSDTKLLAIPADRVQLVQRVLAAGNTGELATELGDGQAKLIGQTGKTSLDTWQLGELVKTMAVRMGSETLAMKVDTDEVEAATREIDDLLASRSPGGESASRSQNPLPAPRAEAPATTGPATLDKKTRQMMRDVSANFGARAVRKSSDVSR
ncbi:hypothetical protein SAMN05880592_10331 [Bosea sp. TND4EK4]|nr:hypothetical protein SAMN05880592_10331 [Bosea sp. TND4EK4]